MSKFTQRSFVYILLLFGIILYFFSPIFRGKIPVPTDTLVGLYHPWRDLYASQFPRGMPYKNFLITDPVRQQIPWRKQGIEQLKATKVPAWSHLNFSGAPLLANIQAGILYPFNIVFFLLPFVDGWTFLIVIQIVLSSLFMLLFLKRLGLQPAAAFLGSIAFTFSGFSIAWLTWGTMLQTVLWLPLLLYCIDVYREEKRNSILLLFIVAFTVSFFAGHIQLFLYVAGFTVWYALYRFLYPANKTYFARGPWFPIGLCIAWASSIIFTLPQWLPLYHLVGQTSRIAEKSLMTKEGWFVPWQQVVQFLIPDFFGNPSTLNYWGQWNYGELIGYIGIVPLLLVAIVVIAGKFSYQRFWILSSICIFAFIVPSFVSKLPFVLSLPFVSSLQPTRLFSVLCFSLSVLAAYGLHHILNNSLKRIWLPVAIFIFVFLIIGVIIVISPGIFPEQAVMIARRNMIFPGVLLFVGGGLLVILSQVRTKSIFLLLLLVVTSVDLLRFANKFTSFSPKETFFPQTEAITYLKTDPTLTRIMSLDDRLFPPNTLGYYGISAISGYDPLSNKRYEAFIAAMERGEPNIAEPYGFNRIISPKNYVSPLFPHLAVSHIASLEKISDLPLLFKEGETHIYQSQSSLPLAYLVSHVELKASDQEIINRLYAPDYIAGKIGIIEEALPVSITGYVGEVLELKQDYSSLRVRTKTDGPMLLIISQPYDSWWVGEIDGEPVKVYRVNFAFQGIVVEKGTHTIELSYGIFNF